MVLQRGSSDPVPLGAQCLMDGEGCDPLVGEGRLDGRPFFGGQGVEEPLSRAASVVEVADGRKASVESHGEVVSCPRNQWARSPPMTPPAIHAPRGWRLAQRMLVEIVGRPVRAAARLWATTTASSNVGPTIISLMECP